MKYRIGDKYKNNKLIYKVQEKAKAYDEAIKRIQSYAVDEYGCTRIKVVDVFPELKESEDERIRKRIIDALHGDVLDMEETTKAIAWLEKQCEQKHADNVIKTKFHKGDWIIHQGTENIYQVVAVLSNHYQLRYGDNYTIQNCADVDRHARLWTIQDAKDGDVLVKDSYPYYGIICLFKKFTQPFGMKLYCSIDEKGQFISYNNCDVTYYHRYDVSLYPATKEQRDLLFQKMNEACYKWDAENKELRSIGQNNTEDECYK